MSQLLVNVRLFFLKIGVFPLSYFIIFSFNLHNFMVSGNAAAVEQCLFARYICPRQKKRNLKTAKIRRLTAFVHILRRRTLRSVSSSEVLLTFLSFLVQRHHRRGVWTDFSKGFGLFDTECMRATLAENVTNVAILFQNQTESTKLSGVRVILSFLHLLIPFPALCRSVLYLLVSPMVEKLEFDKLSAWKGVIM